MANTFRLIRGEPRTIALPKYAADAIEIGDLLYWDATNNAVRNAETVSGADYATKKANFAATFVGVALSAHDADTTGYVLVATDGDFLFACPSGAEYDVTDGVAIGNGSAVADQTVIKTTTAAEIIGRVLELKPSAQQAVVVRIRSKLMS
ncbi:MAG: DUF2190 family protein [Thermogutta sp.]|uniref:capsid cement protein n=1 Tax=Thermogutta sp. TaxID=1962930 RepID=UPI0019C694FE|nr:capsid cement protein [Thermogutta sp.]MBC7350843.1 DUF2190 family protein [Thermogutta sp.]